jgi:murein DD-endopeptidase MepM/ murein hydrolase activator NlpD
MQDRFRRHAALLIKPVRRLSVVSLALSLLLALSMAQAQDGGQPRPPDDGGTTIHVVQRGENLFRIAQKYGTTVEAITTANGITDVRFIEVGQRLLIPNPQVDNPGVNQTYVVQPGETLRTIALRHNSTLDSLATLNDVTNPASLYAGQTITVRQGSNGIEPLAEAGLYVAQPGDTPLTIAARFGIPLTAVASANAWLPGPIPIWPGQGVVIPNRPDAGAFIELPELLTDFSLSPVPARQGESLSLRFTTRIPAQVGGVFMDRPLDLFSDSPAPAAGTTASPPTSFAAMLGVHAFAAPGVYTLRLTFTAADGQSSDYQVRINVVDGGYSQEVITIPTERQDLLDSAVVQAELDRVMAIVNGGSPQRYFDGLMALPAPGPVTSQFGTRRSYNGSDFNTFHGGADFGGPVGTMIFAPASGVVALAEPLEVRGKAVILDHGWGVYSGYWHLNDLFVEVGQVVQKGIPLGTLGNTGLSTGAHLHWELWVDGVQVNPLQWAQQAFP